MSTTPRRRAASDQELRDTLARVQARIDERANSRRTLSDTQVAEVANGLKAKMTMSDSQFAAWMATQTPAPKGVTTVETLSAAKTRRLTEAAQATPVELHKLSPEELNRAASRIWDSVYGSPLAG